MPPGMVVDDGQNDAEVTATGTLHVTSVEGGLWLIAGDDGTVYTSLSNISPEMLVDGARVSFIGLKTPDPDVNGVVVVDILIIEILP